MRIEICDSTSTAIIGTVLITALAIVISLGMYWSYQKDKRDQSLQLEMVEAGYTPNQISCAWNIHAAPCLLETQKGIVQ